MKIIRIESLIETVKNNRKLRYPCQKIFLQNFRLEKSFFIDISINFQETNNVKILIQKLMENGAIQNITLKTQVKIKLFRLNHTLQIENK